MVENLYGFKSHRISGEEGVTMLSDLILSDLDVVGSDQSKTNPSFCTISVVATYLPSKQVSSVQIRYSALAITS